MNQSQCQWAKKPWILLEHLQIFTILNSYLVRNGACRS
jgi:hypothetical protein